MPYFTPTAWPGVTGRATSFMPGYGHAAQFASRKSRGSGKHGPWRSLAQSTETGFRWGSGDAESSVESSPKKRVYHYPVFWVVNAAVENKPINCSSLFEKLQAQRFFTSEIRFTASDGCPQGWGSGRSICSLQRGSTLPTGVTQLKVKGKMLSIGAAAVTYCYTQTFCNHPLHGVPSGQEYRAF